MVDVRMIAPSPVEPYHSCPKPAKRRIRIMPALARRPFWLLTGWTLLTLVAVLSLLPVQQLPDSGFSYDKVNHFVAYCTLMVWFGLLYQTRLRVAVVLLVMGGAIEILQGLSGYREMSALDLLANAAGIAAGALIAHLMPDLLHRLERLLP